MPPMHLTELFAAELERESAGTRRALERVPDGRSDWKPHEKSMPLGSLAALVAKMPLWVELIIQQDDFDIRQDSEYVTKALSTSRELLAAHESAVARAQAALRTTTDTHLMTTWRFRAGDHVISELPRHINLRDAVLNHQAHHRGQLTVYLRLLGASVPAIYGPSADEGRFA